MQFIWLTLMKAKFVSGCCVAVSIINLGVISFNYTSLSVLFVSRIIFFVSARAPLCVSLHLFLFYLWEFEANDGKKRRHDFRRTIKISHQFHMCHAQHTHTLARSAHSLSSLWFSFTSMQPREKENPPTTMMIMIMNNVRIRLNSKRLCACFSYFSNKFTYRSICVHASKHCKIDSFFV